MSNETAKKVFDLALDLYILRYVMEKPWYRTTDALRELLIEKYGCKVNYGKKSMTVRYGSQFVTFPQEHWKDLLKK